MIIEKTFQGAWKLSELHQGYLVTEQYIGYTKSEAKQLFKEYLESITEMNKYKLVSYEVWGNPKDGYEVNTSTYTDIEIELPEEYTDLDLRRELFKSRYATRGILTASLEINHDYPDCIYINLTGSRYGGMKPFCELRLIKD